LAHRRRHRTGRGYSLRGAENGSAPRHAAKWRRFSRTCPFGKKGGRSPMKTSSKAPSPKKVKAETWELRLYTAGQSPKSVTAFANLKKLCEEHLKGQY